MGIAIIVPNVSFETYNLGKVTQTGDLPVEDITIIGPTNVIGSFQYSIKYNPSSTPQIGVFWSIIEGNEYATIDNEGFLKVIKDGNIRIKAVSIYNESISNEFDVSVKNVNVLVGHNGFGTYAKNRICSSNFIAPIGTQVDINLKNNLIIRGVAKNGSFIATDLGNNYSFTIDSEVEYAINMAKEDNSNLRLEDEFNNIEILLNNIPNYERLTFLSGLALRDGSISGNTRVVSTPYFVVRTGYKYKLSCADGYRIRLAFNGATRIPETGYWTDVTEYEIIGDDTDWSLQVEKNDGTNITVAEARNNTTQIYSRI